MTLVLEESEDVPLELLTPMLASLRMNNEVRYSMMYVMFYEKICKLSMLSHLSNVLLDVLDFAASQGST